MKKICTGCIIALAFITLIAGCGGSQPAQGAGSGAASGSGSLVVYSPLTLEFMKPIVERFEKESGIKMEIIALGTGEALKRVESEKNNPLADVLWSGATTTVKSKMDLFENYQTPNESAVDPKYKNIEGPLTRFDATGSIMMANTNLLGNIRMEGYQDLLNPVLKGKIAMADPSASSSAFEHIETMLFAMGGGDNEKGWDFIKKFCAQLDGKLLGSSSAVYKGVADGEYTVGLTFEEGGATYLSLGAPIKLVYMEEGVTFRGDGIEIIKGCKNLENAKKFLDFCTSYDVQKLMNDSLNRRTVRTDLPPSPILKPLSEMKILEVDEDMAAAKRQEWINKFKEIFTSL
ncbi:MAG: ABC transporter substrate-binding protein [Spirochaetales bacterium]|jgi:iron(III) transport system substrate-binding protein|nr:ABC transporter substrate-binding protein [Spirochaetales bacterium]